MYITAKNWHGTSVIGAMGSRTGLGALSCPGDPGCPGYVAPEPMPNQTQQQIADIWDYLWNGPGSTPSEFVPIAGPPPVAATQQTASQWLNANASTVALGVGGLLLVSMFAKAGR